ncbi:MAG TPA: hypothetical protein VGN09_14945 [Vicinamibacteria bacterium]
MRAQAFRAVVWTAALIALPAAASEPSFETLKIVAPASAGGGWDQTARAMAEALRAAGIARSVEVTNSPGAGGAIGLAQFVSAQKGEGSALLVGGLFMMEAIRTNGATVSLLQTNPIARLTGEHEAIAVPADSEFKTLEDLV